jgi:hypothetical protein
MLNLYNILARNVLVATTATTTATIATTIATTIIIIYCATSS